MRKTLRDVARQAGVSEATVSRILKGTTRLYSDATVARVQAAARELNYVPNILARSLVRRRTHLIALASERRVDFRRDSYFFEVFSGIHEAARDRGYNVTILTALESGGADLLRQVQSGLFDGVILIAPALYSPVLEWAGSIGYPVVSAGSTLPDRGLTCVDVDNIAAAQQAAEYLLQKGHRKIGFVGGQPTHLAAFLRHAGYERALNEAGVEPLPWLWNTGDNVGQASGKRAMNRLRAAHPEATAVFCVNDETAVGALESLMEQGVSVPDEVSVMGFDDAETARWVRPALTTVRQEIMQVGQIAAERLITRIETEDFEPETVLLPGKLVERDSVRSLPTI
ncbi:MAG: LacI family DNA-binding transcriptional regulator [Armatimonadaceae bacterium]